MPSLPLMPFMAAGLVGVSINDPHASRTLLHLFPMATFSVLRNLGRLAGSSGRRPAESFESLVAGAEGALCELLRAKDTYVLE